MTYKPEVVKSVVIIDAIDMVKDKTHRFTLPLRGHTTDRTLIRKHLIFYDTFLESVSWIGALCYEDFFVGLRRTVSISWIVCSCHNTGSGYQSYLYT